MKDIPTKKRDNDPIEDHGLMNTILSIILY
jgi:hypothetical protein